MVPGSRLPATADPKRSGAVWWHRGSWCRVVLKEGKDKGAKRFQVWRARVEQETRRAWCTPFDGWKSRAPLAALWVGVTFVFPRLKAHYYHRKSGEVLRPDAPTIHTTRPDTDKLERALGDGFERAGLCQQDSRIVGWTSDKRYGAQPGAQIAIYVPEEGI